MRNRIIILILLLNLATYHATQQVHVTIVFSVRSTQRSNAIVVKRGVSMCDKASLRNADPDKPHSAIDLPKEKKRLEEEAEDRKRKREKK